MGPRVVIIGAGFGGLGTGRVLGQGIDDVTILECADDIGVWRDNTQWSPRWASSPTQHRPTSTATSSRCGHECVASLTC